MKKYKDQLGIKKIVLSDNSIKQCNNLQSSNNIILSKMLILITGDTWYGKYGFRPYDNIKNRIDKNLIIKYDNNKKIMDTITIKDANILKYIEITNKENIIEYIKKLVKLHPEYLLRDFVKSFLQKYDKMCKYFALFYEQLFDNIGLYNFHQKYFGLEL
jgi:hypothetical protein